jgi:endothelin-converting enzyme/putative endopeptidase
MALHDATAKKSAGTVGGFTPEQRVFLGYAQVWCSKDRDEYMRMRVLTDPHSPARWRVNGVMVNMPEFSQAFSCDASKAMHSQNRCRVW